jgi:hypothetical protein
MSEGQWRGWDDLPDHPKIDTSMYVRSDEPFGFPSVPVVPDTGQPDAQHRNGQALDLVCRQCGTKWEYRADGPTQCPDCLDHMGELIDPVHPDWCMRDRGCSLPAGHPDGCELTA